MSPSFSIENGLKQGDTLSSFNFNLEYAIRKEHDTNFDLDVNGTHEALAYDDDVNLIGDDIGTIERNAEVSLNACKDIGLRASTGKTKCMEVGRYRDTMASEHITLSSNL
jgi:hypothetical protein